MGLRAKAKYVIYRFAEKGLEVFLLEQPQDRFELPIVQINHSKPASLSNKAEWIELDHALSRDHDSVAVIAIEGDWHDLPSIRQSIGDDITLLKNKVKSIATEFDKGTYVGIKEAFKKVLPEEYALLKELKEILADRNTLKNI
jgi:hypothetical protein